MSTRNARIGVPVSHDSHVDAINGHVAHNVVRHGNEVVGSVTREVGGYDAVVTTVLQFGHFKGLRKDVV